MPTSRDNDTSEGRGEPLKWLGLESISPEMEFLSPEDEFFAWATHRQMESRRVACEHVEQEMAIVKMCGCDCDEVACE